MPAATITKTVDFILLPLGWNLQGLKIISRAAIPQHPGNVSVTREPPSRLTPGQAHRARAAGLPDGMELPLAAPTAVRAAAEKRHGIGIIAIAERPRAGHCDNLERLHQIRGNADDRRQQKSRPAPAFLWPRICDLEFRLLKLTLHRPPRIINKYLSVTIS